MKVHSFFHVEGGETFELAGSVPLSLATLDDCRPLFLCEDKSWLRSWPEGQPYRLLVVSVKPGFKVWKTDDLREYWKLCQWSEERGWEYRPALRRLLKEGFDCFSFKGKNEAGDPPEMFFINPTAWVTAIKVHSRK